MNPAAWDMPFCTKGSTVRGWGADLARQPQQDQEGIFPIAIVGASQNEIQARLHARPDSNAQFVLYDKL
jgi:hypothetical protein